MKQDITGLIYDIVERIPPGRVTSYGAIARCLGTSATARVVGWAMNKADSRPGIPAHRVVNSRGILSGKHHFGGNRMQELLEAEGIKVVQDQVQNWEEVFWDPYEGLMN